MKILALELSSACGSLAWRDGKTELAREWANDRKNSGEFFRNLGEVQQRFGLPDRIIVGLGPGSYAGTRIAISAAVGLQLAAEAELVGVSSLCALATDSPEYAVIGDARRQSFFFAHIRDRILATTPALHTEVELRNTLKATRTGMPIFATEELERFPQIAIHYPSAEILARLAEDTNRAFVLPPLEPMYLREPHITTPRPR
ncbi:MAG TPA: tRNA (adenosine(37)-N6)-threonylcarbamoyltransferase complex dimerization subunit type 1 TsaB [Chthoniobacterales bacterium]|nr:tRNA (adenosine(37)-N6)-threonylcarbamoyltransferase complex dimerization subunit type 1 TsaB [Chthoniobacterales bacterium]